MTTNSSATSSATLTPTSKRGIWGWMLFDWAAQPFHTLIITFVFAPYFTSFVASDGVTGQALWGQAAGIGGILIAILAPILGAIADNSGRRKPWIAVFSIFAIIGSFALWFALPNSPNTTVILIAFVIALIGVEFATVFTNAMMPDLVSREELGKLSGTGWALGYVGGLIALILVLGFMSASPDTGKTMLGFKPLFGLDASTNAGDRAAGPLTAFWYLVFILPLFLFTPDVKRQVDNFSTNIVMTSLRDLGQTIRKLPSQRSYFSFLMSSMLYRDGLNAIYIFGGIYAAGVLGWSIIQVGIFGIIASITGAIGAFVGGRMDSRHGARPVVFVSIILLIIAVIIVISIAPSEVFFIPVSEGSSLPTIVFYLAGGLVGAAGGSLQASSRTLLVDQVEPENMTEAFGLYALTGRATSFIGPFGIAWATKAFDSQRIGVSPVIVLLVLGFLLLLFVRERNIK